MALVDIVIPFYNSDINFTEFALQSVLSQTFTEWKIILVNDGSNKKSTQEIELLIKKINDDRITYHSTTNNGVASTRNFAIAVSRSPYIAFLDQDDYWYPDKLEKQVVILEKDPDVALVFSKCDDEMPDGNVLHRSSANVYIYNEMTRELLFEMMLSSNYVPMVTAMVRREPIVNCGAFDGNFGGVEDKELWLRLLLHRAKFFYIDEFLAVHRLHSSNQSKMIEQIKNDRLNLIAKIESELQKEVELKKKIHWEDLKKEMLCHLYQEAIEGYLEKKQYKNAMQLCWPKYIGVSAYSMKLFIVSFVRLFA